MRRIGIVMPYYDRQYQLTVTLNSIAKSAHQNYFVVVVDDNSPVDVQLPNLPYHTEVIKLTNKTWTNVAPVYNFGFHKAIEYGAEIIIIQSSECYHVGDILSHADANINNNNYIAYGCFQIDKDTTFSEHDIMALAKKHAYKVDGDNKGLGVNAWWNHTVYSPLPQYWGASVSVDVIKKMNGIDERFAYGHAFEDGWFLYQLANMGVKIDIVDYPFVVHQWHSRIWANKNALQARKKQDAEFADRNKNLYLRLRDTKEYKSQHFITPDF